MEIIKKGYDEVKNVVSHRIDSGKLEPGHHIYCYRQAGTYTHHGIFVGDSDDNGVKKVLQVIHFNSTQKGKTKPDCPNCTTQSNMLLGVVKTCLDCFLKEGDPTAGRSVRHFKYGVSYVEYKITVRGTCSTKTSKPLDQVVKTAEELFISKNGFETYDVRTNNCEHFATFCSTGEGVSAQVGSRITGIGKIFSS